MSEDTEKLLSVTSEDSGRGRTAEGSLDWAPGIPNPRMTFVVGTLYVKVGRGGVTSQAAISSKEIYP